ncbi:MAG: DUF2029 domain-containing protein [Bacteroidetes bacterium]|nr:MAG: DUF2029 domain-containing protein [Bacteroidota bacterium]
MNFRLNIPNFLLFFCLAFIGLNLIRLKDISRESESPLDQRQPFFAGKLYSQEKNPYNDELLKQAWHEESQAGEWVYSKQPGGPENYMLYPPFVASLYSLFSDYSWFQWGNLWYTLEFVLLFGFILLAFFHFERKHFWAFLAFLLAYKALFPALMLGQPLWISLLAGMGFLYFRKSNSLLAAIFLTITAFKPSIALPLFAFTMVYDFRQLLYAVGLVLLLQIPFFLHFGKDSFLIIQDWLHNMEFQQAIVFSDAHDFLVSNLVDISPVLGKLGIGLWLEKLLLLGSVGLILLGAFKKWYSEEQSLALLLLASLSFSYHLYYDVFILLLSIPYFMKKEWWYSVPLLALFLPGLSSLSIFLTPLLLLFALVLHLSSRDSKSLEA